MTNQDTFNLLGLATTVLALVLALGGCATVSAQTCLGAPPMCPYGMAPVCMCVGTSCKFICVSAQALCECSTDIDCETKCGGSY